MTGPARQRLTRRFYARKPDVVARALLGQILVHRDRAGVIVETEAYFDGADLASHARFGETDRNRVMFGPGGVAYVYLCYGVHHMFNVVADREGTAGAVLVRALAPLQDSDRAPSWANGPGKLTRALGLTREHDGADLIGGRSLYIARGPSRIARAAIASGPRVGVDYAGAWADEPLRFWVADHPAVSRR